MKGLDQPLVAADALSHEQATALTQRPTQEDFLACGFVYIGVWGRRPISQPGDSSLAWASVPE